MLERNQEKQMRTKEFLKHTSKLSNFRAGGMAQVVEH
jgi:hypothetical protein